MFFVYSVFEVGGGGGEVEREIDHGASFKPLKIFHFF